MVCLCPPPPTSGLFPPAPPPPPSLTEAPVCKNPAQGCLGPTALPLLLGGRTWVWLLCQHHGHQGCWN